MKTQQEIMRSFLNLLNEAAPKPPFASHIGDAEWAELVDSMGLANAEKQARQTSPEYHQSRRDNDLAYTQTQAAKKDLLDPMHREKTQQQLDIERIRAQGGELRDTMRAANMQDLDTNKLGQIGQMSSIWQPKNNKTNYQAQPGDVRFTGNNTQAPAAARTASGAKPMPSQAANQAAQQASQQAARPGPGPNPSYKGDFDPSKPPPAPQPKKYNTSNATDATVKPARASNLRLR